MRGLAFVGILGAAALLSPAAAAAEFPAEMDGLFAEGSRWFREAGNTELSTADRNAARVKSWKCLWPVKEALERHEEEHPGDAESLARKYGDVRMMVHWLRKESPIGLLTSSGVGPRKGEDEDETAAPPAAEPARPAPGANPASPAAPSAKPADPAKSAVETLYAAAEEYERRHRADAPGIQARWLRVVAALPDPANPLVRKAMERAGEMESRLKDAYRLLRNEDPDALKGVENARLKGMAITVARDLASAEPGLRERAAATLGTLAHAEGVYALRKALEKEETPAAADAMAEALVRIGGGKAAAALADFKADGRHAPRALDALVRLAKRNPVDRRIAAKEMARFVGAREEELFDRMLATQKGLGYDGVVGMAACCEHNTTASRLVTVIDALSVTKEPAVVRVLAKYFQPGRGPDDERIREAAMNAVRRMAQKENLGEAVVPHLFVGVRNRHTRGYTTLLLQELTGQTFTVKQWARWSAWWKSTHPEWKEGKDEKGGEEDER